jgi:hypothetical protein
MAKVVVSIQAHMTWFEIKERRKFEFEFKLIQVQLPLIHRN